VIGQSFRLFRVFGIDVGIHVSWLLIFALVTFSLAVGFFPLYFEDLSVSEAWLLGAVASLLLFGSVLVHELAHALVARRRGLEATSITLFLFGGVANLGSDTKRPSTEFLVAIVGPITSFAIAGVAWVASEALGPDTRAGLVAFYLAVINALLAVFNLVPGFPLDGGRVLRAIVWNATGSRRRGTEVAGRVGQLVAYGLMVWGFVRVLGGDLLGGIWTLAIGWFLNSAAIASVQQVVVDQRLSGLRVRDVLRPDETSVLPGRSVAELIDEVMLPDSRRAVPVVDGRLVGIVTLSDVRKVDAEKRRETSVAEIMSGPDGLVTVSPEDRLMTALEALGKGDFEQVPVVDRGTLLGLLNRADIVRAIQVRELLDAEGDGRTR
jgi:Zn-dependent protease/CBS domain-containing protein